jgi:ADP-ribosylarginine hydrolase
VSALFTAYAIENIPVVSWGRKMVKEDLPKAYKYLETTKRDIEHYQKSLHNLEQAFKDHLQLRDIWEDDKTKATFPAKFDVKARDGTIQGNIGDPVLTYTIIEYYKSISYDGWGGASGDDSCIIAYDALLGCEGNWTEFCLRGVLHGGDCDSTGAIGGAWFGAMYGFHGESMKV